MTQQTYPTDRLPDAGAGFVWRTHGGGTVALHPNTDGARASFTTRVGGVSGPPLDGLNLSWSVAARLGMTADADNGIEEVVLTNRGIAARTIVPDWPTSQTERWCRVHQVHGADVVKAQHLRPADADALWTDDPDLLIAVLVADCVPILLTAPGRVAAVHAGWRGLVAGVVGNAVEEIGGAPEAFAGPAIGPCCFEVGPEVVDGFHERFGPAPLADDSHVDLWTAAEIAAREAGVDSFHAARLCTSCHPELFFSHRRDRGRTGRQALVAAMPER